MKKFIFVLCLSLMSTTLINASKGSETLTMTNSTSPKTENSMINAYVVTSFIGGMELYFHTEECAIGHIQRNGGIISGRKLVRGSQAFKCI